MEGDRIQWIQGGFLSRPVLLMGVHLITGKKRLPEGRNGIDISS